MRLVLLLMLVAVGTLAACVAQESTLNTARQESAHGHIEILEALETGETKEPLRRQYRESEGIASDLLRSQENSGFALSLVEALGALVLTGGGATALSRVLSRSKPRLDELTTRVGALETTPKEKK